MIIRYFAKKTTQKCLTEEESEYTKNKIEYGLELLFDTIVKILGLLGMAFILDVEIYFSISVISFCVLRYYAGRIHLRDNWSCFLCTVMICFLPYIIGGHVCFSALWHAILLIVSYLLVAQYAPWSSDNNPIIEPKIRKRNNRRSRIIVLMAAVVSLSLLKNKAYLITIPIFVESITILPIWRKKHTYFFTRNKCTGYYKAKIN